MSIKYFDDYRKNPIYRYMMGLMISSVVGLQVWQNLFNNYAVDVIGLNAFQVGVTQSVRELAGLLKLHANELCECASIKLRGRLTFDMSVGRPPDGRAVRHRAHAQMLSETRGLPGLQRASRTATSMVSS